MSKDRSPKRGQLLYFAIAYGGSAALQKALGFGVFMWLAHSLSVHEYATFGLLYALQTGVAALAGAGILESVIGALKRRASFDLRPGLFGAANTAFVLLTIPCIAIVAATYSLFLRDEAVTLPLVACVIIAGLVSAYATLQASLVRLEENHGESLVLSFLVPLGGLAGGIIGFTHNASVGVFFAASALGLTLTSLALGLRRFGFYGLTRRRGDVMSILSNIAPFVFIAVLSWVGGYGTTYLVKSLFSTSDVANFTFAFTLSGVMQLVATSLNQVWAPRFYRLVNELPVADVERRNRRFFMFQGLSLGAVGAVLIIALPFALDLFGGNLLTYRGLTLELLLLCSAYAVSIPWWHSQNFFYANNKGRELMNVTIVGSVAGVCAWVASAWVLGVIGIYLGFMLQMLARTVAAVIAARSLWSVRVHWEGVALALLLMSAGAGLVPLLYSKP